MQNSYWPTAEWKSLEASTLGMDSNQLSKIETIVSSEYSNINGIVVLRKGRIAYEQYYNGFGLNDTHHVTSVTKSILSALIGIAIDAKYVKSVDQHVLDFFPEYVPDAADRQKREITIRHLLTMTAPYAFEDWREPLDKMCMHSDWIKYTLDMLGQRGSIGSFKYSTAGTHLLSAILTRATGLSAREFANEHLFKPIGMKEIQDYNMKSFGFDDLFGVHVKGWVNDPKGITAGGWGLTLTPRDMARFGLLYLNQGKWGHRQVISGTWIQESVEMNLNKYGYLWWLREEDGVFAYLALGDGGNVICCIPAKDLVVAIASEFIIQPRDRWTLIKEYIIPAIVD